MKILIDNGHGKETPGKRSPDGVLREYSYTRDIARRIVDELRSRGLDAELLVPEDSDIPLAERCRRANEACGMYGTQNVVLVSVHCNAAGNGQDWMKAAGWSAYTGKGQTGADDLTDILYEEAGKNFIGRRIRTDFSDGDPDWEEGFYILRKTKCAAVLTENFFQDNRDDVEFLLSDAGKDAIVRTHVDALSRYAR